MTDIHSQQILVDRPGYKGRLSSEKRRGSVIDLFCGAGGLSHGFRLEGYAVMAGIDIDEACRYAFETNNVAPFIRKSVVDLSGSELSIEFRSGEPRILVGCAPCQPFSKYSQKHQDPRWSLLHDFARLIQETCPDIVSMENVPSLVKFRHGAVFDQFVGALRNDGYHVNWSIVYCPDFGIPQSRSRLVLLASRYGIPPKLAVTHQPDEYATVHQTIGALPKLQAGDVDECDPLHRCRRLSEINLERIRLSKPGGSWRDWPGHLVAECHKKETGHSYSSVYGRMQWSKPAPTMTTQFSGFGNGRFGHPEQDRAISLREGAMLQTFPRDYAFVAPGEDIHIKTLGRLIGNAVPVDLGRAIACAVAQHIEEYNG